MTSIVKRIADPVHKFVGLTQAELDIISTPTFQRLRNVKQLGLVSLVFPSADYSRFSHSLGVCHVTNRLFDAIARERSSVEELRPLYRMAALLHDIGHYPFSHTMEKVLRDLEDDEIIDEEAEEKDFLYHEDVGELVLECSPDIAQVLKQYDLDPKEISNIFRRQSVDPRHQALLSLVSSDLDADRLDYLLRNSHHSGLPFGQIDIDYLISQATLFSVSDEEVIGFGYKRQALRTVDHFLLGRYIDYHQLVFNKTYVGFEWLLTKSLRWLVENAELHLSSDSIRSQIMNGCWSLFDDIKLIEAIRKLATKSGLASEMSRAVINRQPPFHIVSYEGFKGINETVWNQWSAEAVNWFVYGGR